MKRKEKLVVLNGGGFVDTKKVAKAMVSNSNEKIDKEIDEEIVAMTGMKKKEEKADEFELSEIPIVNKAMTNRYDEDEVKAML